MDKHKIIEAIDKVVNGLQELKVALLVETVGGEKPTTQETQEQPTSPAIELLASKVAYAYSTKHPEYEVDKLLCDLKEMISGDKITYVIYWMKKGNTEGLGGFFNLEKSQQRDLLQKALAAQEQEIKEIFTKRFLKNESN